MKPDEPPRAKKPEARQPELKIEELLALLDDIKWDSGYQFIFNGTKFHIMITSKDELAEAEAEGKLSLCGEPAEFMASSAVSDGYDIYLHDTILKSERRRVLFHEILEANLTSQGFRVEGHAITQREEERIFGSREK